MTDTYFFSLAPKLVPILHADLEALKFSIYQ